jgi:hypothetical protein
MRYVITYRLNPAHLVTATFLVFVSRSEAETKLAQIKLHKDMEVIRDGVVVEPFVELAWKINGTLRNLLLQPIIFVVPEKAEA